MQCYTGALDGNWGPSTKDALTKLSKLAKVDLKTDEPSDAVLNALAIQKGQVCSAPQSVASFDGRWKLVWHAVSGCAITTSTEYRTVKNGTISGDRVISGKVSPNGTFSVITKNRIPGAMNVHAMGQLVGNHGSGRTTNRGSDGGTCIGTSTWSRNGG